MLHISSISDAMGWEMRRATHDATRSGVGPHGRGGDGSGGGDGREEYQLRHLRCEEGGLRAWATCGRGRRDARLDREDQSWIR